MRWCRALCPSRGGAELIVPPPPPPLPPRRRRMDESRQALMELERLLDMGDARPASAQHVQAYSETLLHRLEVRADRPAHH
jgi:hypothetical protein